MISRKEIQQALTDLGDIKRNTGYAVDYYDTFSKKLSYLIYLYEHFNGIPHLNDYRLWENIIKHVQDHVDTVEAEDKS